MVRLRVYYQTVQWGAYLLSWNWRTFLLVDKSSRRKKQWWNTSTLDSHASVTVSFSCGPRSWLRSIMIVYGQTVHFYLTTYKLRPCQSTPATDTHRYTQIHTDTHRYTAMRGSSDFDGGSVRAVGTSQPSGLRRP